MIDLTRKEDQDGSTPLMILERIIKTKTAKKQDITYLAEIKDMILREQIQDSALPDDVAHGEYLSIIIMYFYSCMLISNATDDDDGSVGSGSGSDSD